MTYKISAKKKQKQHRHDQQSEICGNYCKVKIQGANQIYAETQTDKIGKNERVDRHELDSTIGDISNISVVETNI